MRFFKPALQKLTQKLTDRHFVRVAVIILGCVAVSVIIVTPVFAAGAGGGTVDWIAHNIIAPFEFFIISALGKLELVLFDILKTVAGYNDFINADAVAKGWIIVRDVANMFFILILLVIAFGTLFGIEKYNYNEWLRKVVIMAVLINFSKLITGFFIDLMQVIMMTFVNAFADMLAGNLTTAVGLKDFLALDPNRPDQDVTSLAIAVTLFIGILMMATLVVVTGAYVVMFLVRIIALWVLTVLSPLAYLLAAFPDTAEYAQRWWKEFWKYATIGPVLAFFLWLALTITQSGNTSSLVTKGSSTVTTTNASTFDTSVSGQLAAGLSTASSSDGILSFLIAIILLVISLSIAAESGAVIGAGIADKTKKLLGRSAVGMVTSPWRSNAAQSVARNATALVAMSRIPVLNNMAYRAYTKLEKYKSGKKKEEEENAQYAKNRFVARRVANPLLKKATKPILQKVGIKKDLEGAASKWRREALVEQYDPAAAGDEETLKKFYSEFAIKNFGALSKKKKKALAEKTRAMGIDIAEVAPKFTQWLANNGNDEDQKMFGLKEWNFDNRSKVWYKHERDAAGRVVYRGGKPVRTNITDAEDFHYRYSHPGAPTGSPYIEDVHGPKWSYLMGVGAQRYTSTKNALYDHGGDMNKFFGSADYAMGRNNGDYLSREEYEDAAQGELQLDRDVAADRMHIGDLQVNDSAIERGMQGQSMTMYDDMMDGAYAQMDFDPNAAGVHLENDAEKQQFAAIAREKFKQAQEQQRSRDMVESMYLLIEAEKALGASEVAGLDSETLTPEKRNELWHKLSEHDTQYGTAHTMEAYANMQSEDAAGERIGALQMVKEDTAYQQKLSADADRLYSSMVNASSIDLVNQRRVGVSRYHTEQHETAHAAVDHMDDGAVNAFFGALDPARQQEMLQEFQRRWGAITSPGNLLAAKREIITDMAAANATGRKTSSFALQRAEQGDLYDETEKTINTQFRGNAQNFYQSQQYQANRDKYLSADAYGRNKKYRNTQQRIQNFAYGGDAKKFFKSAEFKGDKGGEHFISELDFRREENEGKLAESLGEHLADSHDYRARDEVQTIPIEIRRKIWQQIPEAHRQLSAQYIRGNINSKANDDEVMTVALSQMLSAHRGGRANGPLTLKTKDEQETAFMLHTASQLKTPRHAEAPARPPSVASASTAEVAAKATARTAKPAQPRAPEHVGAAAAHGVISAAQMQQMMEGMSGIFDQQGVPDAGQLNQALGRLTKSIDSLTHADKGLAITIEPLSRQVRLMRQSLASARNQDETEAVYKQLEALRTTYLNQPQYQQSDRHSNPTRDNSLYSEFM